MAKKRKTRTQKIAADRRNLSTISLESPSEVQSPLPTQRSYTYSLTENTIPSHTELTSTKAITVSQYDFLAKDLLKTSIVTGAIIVAELVLSQVLR
jgi:hypothetical protein